MATVQALKHLNKNCLVSCELNLAASDTTKSILFCVDGPKDKKKDDSYPSRNNFLFVGEVFNRNLWEGGS